MHPGQSNRSSTWRDSQYQQRVTPIRTPVPPIRGTGVRVSKGKEDSPDSPADSAGQKDSVRVEGDEEITTIPWD